MSNEPVLTYSTPPAPVERFMRTYVWSLITFLIPAVIFTCFLLLVVPRFREIFKDFRTSLPAITQWLLSASSFMMEYWIICIPLLMLLSLVLPILPALYVSTARSEGSVKNRKRLVRTLLLLASSFFLVILLIALLLPLVKLIRSVSGGAGAP